MTTQLPRDNDDNVIPALRLKNGGAHKITTTATTARNTTAFDAATRIVSLYATSDVYLNFGEASVTATTSDHFFPAGVYYDLAIGGDGVALYTHLAALRVTSDGVLYISEKE